MGSIAYFQSVPRRRRRPSRRPATTAWPPSLDGDVLHDDSLLAAGFQALQRQAPALRHLKEPRGRIGEARVLDRRERAPQRAVLGHAPEELHARVMGRGDLVREHFLEAGFRAGGHGRIQRRREDAGLGGRVRAVLGGIDADHGGLLERAQDVLPRG